MSKALTQALAEIRTAIEKDEAEPPAAAIITVLAEGLGYLERIAVAAEKLAETKTGQ